MAEPIIDRPKHQNANFKKSVAKWVDEGAEDLVASGKLGREKKATLKSFAAYVESRNANDPLVAALLNIAKGYPTEPATDADGRPTPRAALRRGGQSLYEPTPQGRRLIRHIGDFTRRNNAPDESEMFAELVSLGVEDVVELNAKIAAQAKSSLHQVEERNAELERECEGLRDTARQHEITVGENEVLRQDNTRLQRVNLELTEQLEAAYGEEPAKADSSAPAESKPKTGDDEKQAEQPEKQTKAGKQSRRTKVPDERGIYTSLVGDEWVLEIGYSDDNGKQRWRRLSDGSSVEDARKLRAELAGKPHTDTEEEQD